MTDPSPTPQPSVNISVPDLQTLMSLGGGGGSIPTTGPDVWGTGAFGSLPVVLTKTQSGGPLKPSNYALLGKRGQQSPPATYQPLSFTDNTATVNDALQGGYKLSADQLKTLQRKLWLAGMYEGTGITNPNQIPYGQYDEATIQAYGNLLKLSASQYQRGQDVTVDDTLAGLIQQRTATGQANTNGTTTRTSTSVSLSDPETAKAILTNVLQAYTGVGIPDAGTISAFQQALNSYEREHPSTTTSTYSSDGSGTDTTSEGVSGLSSAGRTQFAQDYLFQHQGNQVANYQAATTYYQAALQALQAPVQIGSNG